MDVDELSETNSEELIQQYDDSEENPIPGDETTDEDHRKEDSDIEQGLEGEEN